METRTKEKVIRDISIGNKYEIVSRRDIEKLYRIKIETEKTNFNYQQGLKCIDKSPDNDFLIIFLTGFSIENLRMFNFMNGIIIDNRYLNFNSTKEMNHSQVDRAGYYLVKLGHAEMENSLENEVPAGWRRANLREATEIMIALLTQKYLTHLVSKYTSHWHICAPVLGLRSAPNDFSDIVGLKIQQGNGETEEKILDFFSSTARRIEMSLDGDMISTNSILIKL